MNLLVRGGDVLGAEGALRRADVVIRAGAIAEVGEGPAEGEFRELDASGSLVVPGLVNAHMHSGENFNPGRYENLPLDLWFVHSHQVTRTEPPPREEIYARTMLGALLMLKSGTTTAVDFLYEAPEITLETLEPVVQAYGDAGLRATVMLGVADRPFLDSLPLDEVERAGAPPEAPVPSVQGILELAHTAIDRWHEPDGRIQIGIAPSAPQRCSDELLEATWRLAQERDVMWHTHVLETKTQRFTAQELHGRSFVEELAARGYVGRRAAFVHAVWLSDRDIELLHETDTTMIHCLLSNLRLGDGIARLPALVRGRVRVALGTDGRGCDETLDMLELAKATALVHKARGERREEWPTAADVFAMATRDASICAGHGERLGRIEPGAHGDLVLLRRESLPFTPLLDPVRQLVFGAPSREVQTVVVGGEIAVEGGRVTGVDEARIRELARQYAPPLGGAATDDLLKLEAIVDGAVQRAETSDVGLNAYIGSGLGRKPLL